jgi:hypothetical protein
MKPGWELIKTIYEITSHTHMKIKGIVSTLTIKFWMCQICSKMKDLIQ